MTTGKTNIITLAWHTPISRKPPLYGISIAPKRYSHALIEKSKEFVINFIPYSLVEAAQFCGTHSGRSTDKLCKTGLTLAPSKKLIDTLDQRRVRTPGMQTSEECPLW